MYSPRPSNDTRHPSANMDGWMVTNAKVARTLAMSVLPLPVNLCGMEPSGICWGSLGSKTSGHTISPPRGILRFVSWPPLAALMDMTSNVLRPRLLLVLLSRMVLQTPVQCSRIRSTLRSASFPWDPSRYVSSAALQTSEFDNAEGRHIATKQRHS